jgi:hypothetical protein
MSAQHKAQNEVLTTTLSLTRLAVRGQRCRSRTEGSKTTGYACERTWDCLCRRSEHAQPEPSTGGSVRCVFRRSDLMQDKELGRSSGGLYRIALQRCVHILQAALAVTAHGTGIRCLPGYITSSIRRCFKGEVAQTATEFTFWFAI